MTAFDPETNEAFGFVNLGNPQDAELGYISITEIENLRLPMGLKIERDLHFDPMNLGELINKIKQGDHV